VRQRAEECSAQALGLNLYPGMFVTFSQYRPLKDHRGLINKGLY
jgi:hypothetical protein